MSSLKLASIAKNPNEVTIVEPVPQHCIREPNLHDLFISQWFFQQMMLTFAVKKQSVPVVPWNAEQTSILSYEPFILLLHQLGFHLPVDAGKLFVRVPEFWTADILFSVAAKLGPVDRGTTKNKSIIPIILQN